jgi:hypothetical protein
VILPIPCRTIVSHLGIVAMRGLFLRTPWRLLLEFITHRIVSLIGAMSTSEEAVDIHRTLLREAAALARQEGLEDVLRARSGGAQPGGATRVADSHCPYCDGRAVLLSPATLSWWALPYSR